MRDARLASYATEWHQKIISGGWIPILSSVSKDLIHFAAVHAIGKAVPLNFSVLKDCIGNTKTPILRAVAELEGYGLLQRLPQDLTEKANAYLAKQGVETAEIIVQLKEPYQIRQAERWVLREPKVRNMVSLLTRPEEIPDDERKEIRKRMEAIKTSGSANDSIWYGVYERLYRVLTERQKRPRTAIEFQKLIAFITPTSPEELAEINKELFPASTEANSAAIDWRELNSYEKRVIQCYETFSGKKLRADELELVREALRLCYPSQITAGIRRYSGSIPSFEYLMPMIRKGAFGKRRSKQQEESKGEERPIGKAVSTNEWDERRKLLREKAKRNKAQNAAAQ